MYNVKTFNAITQDGLDKFSDKYQINQSDNPDAYLVRSANMLEAEFPENLKVIVRAGAGFNNLPIERLSELGIAAFNTPGSNANAVKEVVLSMIIASVRHLFAVAKFSANNLHADISKMKKIDPRFKGTEIKDKTLAVIGLGHVGSLVANAANDLGMEVVGYDPYLSSDAAWRIESDITRAKTLEDAIKDADIVTVHVPKNDETTNLINDNAIKQMKCGVSIINYARLGIVNNQAVVDALNEGKVASYITDFGDDILLNREDVVITPHIGGSTIEAEGNGAIRGAKIIQRYLETGNLSQSLNLPNMNVAMNSPYRITVIHKNIPNMVGQIATKAAENNFNIDQMSNAAKDKLAYTIVDFSEQPTSKLLAELQLINDVIKVRLIQNK
ncbi:Phosphoglycerate dehydrogenase [Apilactobacillus kunkeei]|uniref:3-phosphoglycerate dehydrogenase family protein n=1 Tax=Apilactobacillus kunkeei TaxID=148814 RepID=UPI0006B24427|nr:3-phosphoglycerate dehydrogenase family protein [Apilactobacillus kunkeei]KOY78249.1 Phosphoglycerate dehydrogenase [Apilactobacillus kunkeei]